MWHCVRWVHKWGSALVAAEMVLDRSCNVGLDSRNGCLGEGGQYTLKQRKRQNSTRCIMWQKPPLRAVGSYGDLVGERAGKVSWSQTAEGLGWKAEEVGLYPATRGGHWEGNNMMKAICWGFEKECAKNVALKSEIECERKLEIGWLTLQSFIVR